jgi:hypothetical protein
MMTDEVLKELWAVKDAIARDHNYDIDRLADYFFQKQSFCRSKFRRSDTDMEVTKCQRS